MATASVRGPVREHPAATTALLSVLGYALVIGTFQGVVPASVFPALSESQVNLFSHLIAAINTVATLLLIAGWRWIRRGEVRKHAAAMSGSFALILAFLVLYLTKIGGGGQKEIVGAPELIYYAYLAMLAIHILLSVVAVPVVLHAIVLGATHTPTELRRDTPHARVGRIAAGSWILSLTLGIVTYLMLNWIYGYRFVESAGF